MSVTQLSIFKLETELRDAVADARASRSRLDLVMDLYWVCGSRKTKKYFWQIDGLGWMYLEEEWRQKNKRVADLFFYKKLQEFLKRAQDYIRRCQLASALDEDGEWCIDIHAETDAMDYRQGL